MIDPDTLYFSSQKYRNLLDVIGDEITDEDLAQRKGRPIEACRHGFKVWDHVQELMNMLRAKSVFELDQSQATIYDLLYWASAFADELHGASLKDRSFLSKQLDFCEHYVEMHGDMLDKDVRNLGNIRISLAEAYYRMGKEKEADALFNKWLSVESDWGWGWIGWSDCYWLLEIPELERDFNKAERILREGLSVPNVMDLNHLRDRLSDLIEKKRTQNQPT